MVHGKTMPAQEIQVIIPVYHTYGLAFRQIKHYALTIKGEWRLCFCDNTPAVARQAIDLDDIDGMAEKCGLSDAVYRQIRKALTWTIYDDVNGIDGERHGSVLDHMVRYRTFTPIVCMHDSDFFWLDGDIFLKAEQYFRLGYVCVGAELFYDDFPYVQDLHRTQASNRTPCVFAQFILRSYVLDKTFVSTRYEGHTLRLPTGWRIRRALVKDNDARVLVFPAVKLPEQSGGITATSWYYLTTDYPAKFLGYHLIQGSGRNADASEAICDEMEKLYVNYTPGSYRVTNNHYVEKIV